MATGKTARECVAKAQGFSREPGHTLLHPLCITWGHSRYQPFDGTLIAVQYNRLPGVSI